MDLTGTRSIRRTCQKEQSDKDGSGSEEEEEEITNEHNLKEDIMEILSVTHVPLR